MRVVIVIVIPNCVTEAYLELIYNNIFFSTRAFAYSCSAMIVIVFSKSSFAIIGMGDPIIKLKARSLLFLQRSAAVHRHNKWTWMYFNVSSYIVPRCSVHCGKILLG